MLIFEQKTAKGQNPRRDTAKGQMLVLIKQDHAATFARLVRNANDTTAAARLMKAVLNSRFISSWRRIPSSETSPFARFVVLNFDTTHDVAARIAEIRSLSFISEASPITKQDSIFLLGCHTFHDSTYLNDPFYADSNLSWFQNTQIYYRDQDMSLPEAWEFTKGNDSTIVAVDGGGSLYDTVNELIYLGNIALHQ